MWGKFQKKIYVLECTQIILGFMLPKKKPRRSTLLYILTQHNIGEAVLHLVVTKG